MRTHAFSKRSYLILAICSTALLVACGGESGQDVSLSPYAKTSHCKQLQQSCEKKQKDCDTYRQLCIEDPGVPADDCCTVLAECVGANNWIAVPDAETGSTLIAGKEVNSGEVSTGSSDACAKVEAACTPFFPDPILVPGSEEPTATGGLVEGQSSELSYDQMYQQMCVTEPLPTDDCCTMLDQCLFSGMDNELGGEFCSRARDVCGGAVAFNTEEGVQTGEVDLSQLYEMMCRPQEESCCDLLGQCLFGSIAVDPDNNVIWPNEQSCDYALQVCSSQGIVSNDQDPSMIYDQLCAAPILPEIDPCCEALFRCYGQNPDQPNGDCSGVDEFCGPDQAGVEYLQQFCYATGFAPGSEG